jgi:putative endonuclease
MKQPAVYMTTNKPYGVIYTGVTSGLPLRIYKHKHGLTPGFAHKYSCTMLVYFELFGDMERAILREKQLKAGSRLKKKSS